MYGPSTMKPFVQLIYANKKKEHRSRQKSQRGRELIILGHINMVKSYFAR
jgi:hypothetical protein